jgi:hypothetical protein
MLAPNTTTEELRAAPAPSPGDAPIAWSPDMVAWLLMLVLFAVVFWFGFVASARALGRCGGRYVAVLTATAVIGAVYLYCFGNPAWQGLRLLDTWCLLWVAVVQWGRLGLAGRLGSLMGWCAGRAPGRLQPVAQRPRAAHRNKIKPDPGDPEMTR